MKYCIPYARPSNFKYYDDDAVSEISVRYNPKDTTLGMFLEKRTDKTIVIEVEDLSVITDNKNDLELLTALYKKFKNFKLRFSFYTPVDQLDAIESAKIPYFFSEFVRDWELFDFIINNYPVTDIAIDGILGFELDKISKLAHSKNIAVRAVPNSVDSIYWSDAAIRNFFVRPNDIKFYNDYIDIFEFAGNTYNVYYEIYEKDKKWDGKLNEIIIGLTSDIDNRNIGSNLFGEIRTTCGKRCIKGGVCTICKRWEYFSKALDEKEWRLD